MASLDERRTVTRLLERCDESARLVALTEIGSSLLEAGAVKVPSLEMLPADEDHVTAVLLVPLTVARNCCRPLGLTVIRLGEIATAICDKGWLELAALPPQPVAMANAKQDNPSVVMRWRVKAVLGRGREMLGDFLCKLTGLPRFDLLAECSP